MLFCIQTNILAYFLFSNKDFLFQLMMSYIYYVQLLCKDCCFWLLFTYFVQYILQSQREGWCIQLQHLYGKQEYHPIHLQAIRRKQIPHIISHRWCGNFPQGGSFGVPQTVRSTNCCVMNNEFDIYLFIQ